MHEARNGQPEYTYHTCIIMVKRYIYAINNEGLTPRVPLVEHDLTTCLEQPADFVV